MAKIGLMGGTFDPIHNGHLTLAKKALEEFNLDQVIFIPNHLPWMKSDRNITADEDRIAMVLAAIKDYKGFDISYIEIQAGGNSYTANTVAELHKEHPENQYYFIMGADSLFTIEKWYNPQVIFDCVGILASVRDDCDYEALEAKRNELVEKFHADIQLMHMSKVEISSTFIRENIYTDECVLKMLPKDVYQIIIEKQLYKY